MVRLQNVLRHLCKTSWRCLKDLLQVVLKLFLKHLEDVFAKRLGDVLKTSWRCLEDVFCKTSSKRMAKANILVLIKTSWRRAQDVFWRFRQKTSSRCLHKEECLLGNYYTKKKKKCTKTVLLNFLDYLTIG